MKAKKIISIAFFLLLAITKLYAQDDYYDEDGLSMNEGFIMAAIGAGIFLFGRLIGEIKAISGLGSVIMVIGGIVCFLGLFSIAMVILTAAINAALKIAMVIGAIALVIWIISGVVSMIKEKSNRD